MSEDSEIIRGGSITSDLPDRPPVYPGKPLAHRYSPADQPRIHEVSRGLAQNKLAGFKPFTPIASVSYPEKTVYLGPVTNIAPRRLGPLSSLRPATDEAPKKVETQSHVSDRIDEQVAQIVEKYKTEYPVVNSSVRPRDQLVPAPSPQPAQPLGLQPLTEELRRLKDDARVVLAKRGLSETPGLREQTPTIKETPTNIGSRDDSTQQLLAEASKIQAEISDLQQQVVQRQNTPDPHEKKEKEYLAQITQLITSRSDLQTKVNSLATELTSELTKRKNAEGRLQENEKKLEALKTELTNTVSKVKGFEETVKNLQEKQIILVGQAAEKKEEEPKQAAQTSPPIPTQTPTQVQSNPQIHGEKELPVLEPPPLTPIAPGKEGPVKIVKPRVAVGKMAPTLTNAPNVINGIVKDQKGLLLSNIIIVVKDSKDEPVRALKSNKIGQFAISTPLPNGIYTMELESTEHNFDLVQIELNGEVLPPIELKANN